MVTRRQVQLGKGGWETSEKISRLPGGGESTKQKLSQPDVEKKAVLGEKDDQTARGKTSPGD